MKRFEDKVYEKIQDQGRNKIKIENYLSNCSFPSRDQIKKCRKELWGKVKAL